MYSLKLLWIMHLSNKCKWVVMRVLNNTDNSVLKCNVQFQPLKDFVCCSPSSQFWKRICAGLLFVMACWFSYWRDAQCLSKLQDLALCSGNIKSTQESRCSQSSQQEEMNSRCSVRPLSRSPLLTTKEHCGLFSGISGDGQWLIWPQQRAVEMPD